MDERVSSNLESKVTDEGKNDASDSNEGIIEYPCSTIYIERAPQGKLPISTVAQLTQTLIGTLLLVRITFFSC